MICTNYFFLLTESSTRGIVCLIMLCMLNLLTYLQQDWINFGATRKYFTIIMLNFKKPETEV